MWAHTLGAEALVGRVVRTVIGVHTLSTRRLVTPSSLTHPTRATVLLGLIVTLSFAVRILPALCVHAQLVITLDTLTTYTPLNNCEGAHVVVACVAMARIVVILFLCTIKRHLSHYTILADVLLAGVVWQVVADVNGIALARGGVARVAEALVLVHFTVLCFLTQVSGRVAHRFHARNTGLAWLW